MKGLFRKALGNSIRPARRLGSTVGHSPAMVGQGRHAASRLRHDIRATPRPPRGVTPDGPDLVVPGPYARRSIPARGKAQEFTVREHAAINKFGKRDGCHSCGSRTAKRKSGNFTPDHQPPSSLVPDGTPQRLYPHCKTCSDKQGGYLAGQARRRKLK